jgi:ectoine utilization protein EutC
MMAVRILNEAELRQAVGIDHESLAAIEQAFTWLADGLVDMPPIMHIGAGEAGDVDVKGAFVRGQPGVVVKIASGFYGNAALGLPSSSGLMVVLDAKTGFCQAVLLDNGYLTDLRTGMAGAVAAKHLARADTRVAGVIGAGAQARYQIKSLNLVRPLARVLVWSRSVGNAERYADEMGESLGIPVDVAASVEAVVRGSDVVVTTTPSREPIVRAEWLHPGLHITAMGSDLPPKRELGPSVLAQADLLVCDSRAQCAILGELHHALDAGELRDDARVVELGEITSGRAAGRSDSSQITVCDLTGTGVQDVAIALLARARAEGRGSGAEV